MIAYEYLDGGAGVLSFWDLQTRERARLEAKLKMLSQVDRATVQHMVSGIRRFGGLFKLQVTVQKVQLRPILCFGPLDVERELTFLMAAYERDWEWEPREAPEIALNRKANLEANPSLRAEYELEPTDSH